MKSSKSVLVTDQFSIQCWFRLVTRLNTSIIINYCTTLLQMFNNFLLKYKNMTRDIVIRSYSIHINVCTKIFKYPQK